MRSPSQKLADRLPDPARDGPVRPDALRRTTLAINATIALAAATAAAPLALIALGGGALLPVILSVLGLAIGSMSLALQRNGDCDGAAAAQAYGLLAIGAVLAAGEPVLAGFGLAVALLAPVHASLLGPARVKRRSWQGVAAVAAIATAAWAGLVPLPPSLTGSGLAGGLAFLTASAAVAYSAHRVGSAYEVYEKAQVSAYRHLVEHVQDAVLRFGADGGLLFASRSSETLLGCRRFELGGGGLLERIHVHDRPAFLTAFAAANRDGEARRLEMRMRRDDPAAPATAPVFAWIEVALSPVLEPLARETRHEVVALLRDVTERRDQEAAMAAARREAEQASQAKSRFLATIGHELRTPLNAIVGFSEMLAGGHAGDMAPAQRDYAALIHKSGLHLVEVVQMLLDMARLEAGRFELDTASFAPAALVEPCLDIVAGLAREKGVRIETDVPPLLPAIVADERACRQILINLLSNAVKFSPDGGVVRLALERRGRHLLLAVSDSGIGMSAADLARLGEPFFQAQDGLSRRYEGTGLGFSIVKGLVALHQGRLDVTSTPGQGTRVAVLLPINGPAIKVVETIGATPLHRDPVPQHMAEWQDERKRAL